MLALRSIWRDSAPGKWHLSSFSNMFHDFSTFTTGSGGRLAWYLPYVRPGPPNFVRIGFSGRSKKLRAEKSCRFVVVLCRDQCFSSPSWPNKISESSMIFTHFVLCSVRSWSFIFSECRRISPVYRTSKLSQVFDRPKHVILGE